MMNVCLLVAKKLRVVGKNRSGVRIRSSLVRRAVGFLFVSLIIVVFILFSSGPVNCGISYDQGDWKYILANNLMLYRRARSRCTTVTGSCTEGILVVW